jgi:hypothetical protein
MAGAIRRGSRECGGATGISSRRIPVPIHAEGQRRRVCVLLVAPSLTTHDGFPSASSDRNRAHTSQTDIGRPSTSDPKPRRFGAASDLAHENDMTGTPQFINPRRHTWAGGPQCIFVRVRHRQLRRNWAAKTEGPSIPHLLAATLARPDPLEKHLNNAEASLRSVLTSSRHRRERADLTPPTTCLISRHEVHFEHEIGAIGTRRRPSHTYKQRKDMKADHPLT